MRGQDLFHGRESTSKVRRRATVNRETGASAAHPLVNLQRKIGNAQVARMLVQRQDVPTEEDEDEVKLKRDPALQRVEEDELNLKRDPALQREEEDDLNLKRANVDRAAAPEVGLAGGPISAGLSDRIQSRRGGGSALDGTTRQSMESSFGADFSGVRVHTDAESDSLNRSVGAKAFTLGSDIFFSRTASPSDSQLLAHELTHVVQQGGPQAGSGPLTVSAADDATEAQADAMAGTVTTGGASVQAARHVEDHDR